MWDKLISLKFNLTKKTKSYIRDWFHDYDDINILFRAIDDAAIRDARSLAYVDKIIVNWKAHGLPLTHEEKIILERKRRQDKFEAGLSAAIHGEEDADESEEDD